MRKTSLLLNVIVVVFFLCFLGYTFVARPHLDSLARQFVTEKTLEYSQPIVSIAAASLDSPIASKFLSKKQATAIRSEIASYQKDPHRYVSDLTRQRPAKLAGQNANPMLEQVASIKEQIRTYYDNTLDALIEDLRIFSLSNLIAGLLAFGLAFFSSPVVRPSITWFSFLMFVAVLYCSYLYIDDLTFFRILFRTHLGRWYPVLLCVALVFLYLDFGRHHGESASRQTVDHTYRRD